MSQKPIDGNDPVNEPAVDPIADPVPPAEPPAEPPAAPPADEPPPASISNEELETMRMYIKRLEEEKAKSEKAAEAANRAKKMAEREKMTEQEQLEEERREIAEMKKTLAKTNATAKAKEVFAGSGLSELEYTPILELIASEDEAKTVDAATEIVGLVANLAKKIKKQVREEILKEVPHLAVGEPTQSQTASFDNAFDAAVGGQNLFNTN